MLAITFLTHSDGSHLARVIDTLFTNTDFHDVSADVHILLQRCSDDYVSRLRILCDRHHEQTHIPFHFHCYDHNLGFARANNTLHQITADYEFVLHIEDDWILYDAPTQWLQTAMTVLQSQSNVSTVVLRRYRDGHEAWQYGWTRTIPYRCHAHRDNFHYANNLGEPLVTTTDLPMVVRPLRHFLFTFNPVVRRTRDYVAAGVYPLPEFSDDSDHAHTYTANGTKEHTAAHWGWCEALSMEKIRHLDAVYLGNGVFVHYDDWADILDTHA